ncbi:hypothetical protein ETAA8_07650 [Anatilimnocola aggregata]|uniref:Uncharacterized protein n=1 Tax=Anatilimnocola aggregata TaxID=2528021 RepID=A0A517Y634_9BACT|nr:hypothetical protein [Anatilimnocola aggregata]QDU25695.1 hypothetical protein ETAA8_07650 [Anatilimnocola aggregata]
MTNRVPLIIAIVLLLLPVLYVGSYLANVRPRPVLVPFTLPSGKVARLVSHYRFGIEYSERIYWPLEQVDRKLRPRAWVENETGP